MGIPVYVIQRGNNCNICLILDEDYRRYISLLSEGALSYSVEILAWVLMTNYVHLLANSNNDANNVTKTEINNNEFERIFIVSFKYLFNNI